MSASNYVYLDVEEIKAETAKAMLLVIDGEEHWVPLSQIADADDYSKGDTDIEVAVTEWFAMKEGLA